jgi:site-specific recombinase XerC
VISPRRNGPRPPALTARSGARRAAQLAFVNDVALDEFAAYGLRDIIAEYRAALRVAGRSPRTIRWYGDQLDEFVRFLERDGVRATLSDLQPPVARRWLLAAQAARSRPLAPASLAGRVRTLRAFGSWVAREFELPANPLRTLPFPRVPQVLLPSLREPDLRALLQATSLGAQPDRDRAIVMLLLDTGLRLAETAGLRVGDVDLVEGRAIVMGKGARQRVVPIGRRTRQALRRVLAARCEVGPEAPLFVGIDGQPLSPHGIQQLFRRLAKRAEISGRSSPHIMRHTFARNFLRNGGDVFSLQRILGHSPSSLQVTRRYVDLDDDDLRAAHREASPVDRLL